MVQLSILILHLGSMYLSQPAFRALVHSYLVAKLAYCYSRIVHTNTHALITLDLLVLFTASSSLILYVEAADPILREGMLDPMVLSLSSNGS